jgi:hypothetical protein
LLWNEVILSFMSMTGRDIMDVLYVISCDTLWYLHHDHLFWVIVDKLAYLLLFEWLEWLEMAHIITLSRSIRLLIVDCWLLIVNCWLLIAVPKIRRLRHPCISVFVYLCICVSVYPQ